MRLLARRILPLVAATSTWIPASPLAAQLPSSSNSTSALVSRPDVPAARTASRAVMPGRVQRAATVRGVVRDSIAGHPLRNAQVQLVSADTLTPFAETIASDSVGAFVFPGVPKGRYLISFFHPLLDSLGIEAPLRLVTVSDDRSVLADLAMPSLTALRGMLCGAAAGSASGGIAMGFVRDARSREPLAGVTVNIEWVELSVGKNGFHRRTPRHVVTTNAGGRYALCDVPRPGTIVLSATRGGDSTDFVEASVADNGLLRRELYLGTARVVSRGDSTRSTNAADSASTPLQQRHVGDGRLSGRVLQADGVRPLAGAQVGMPNGPRTQTNERGEWTLLGAPTGTRTIEARAVGYYPVRQTVDVIEGAPPVVSTLATFKSVLDTMKVVTNYDRFTKLAGFRERSKSGMGRYLTAIDVERRQPINTSDLFRMIPGVYVESGASADTQSIFGGSTSSSASGGSDELTFLMRGTFAGRCAPSIYLNDMLLPNMSASEVDTQIRPKDIIGIEVYASTAVPPQYQQGLSGCGSIVFWTR